MNETLAMLAGGNLLSDGRASEVADQAMDNPRMFSQLVKGLDEPDDVVRGRTAHALERISRIHPDMVLDLLPRFIDLAVSDSQPMVRWHLAMLFPNLPLSAEQVSQVISALLQLLDDRNIFVKSWAIVSLTIFGQRDESRRGVIADKIRLMQDDPSIAIRSKVSKALKCIDNGAPIPTGWVKRGDG